VEVFFVQGSAPAPYRVTAEGWGPALRMTCTCPHGRQGRPSCKHRAALLRGDAGGLIATPPDALDALARRAAGSPLAALTGPAHGRGGAGRDAAADAADRLADAFERHVDALEAAGWRVEALLDPAGEALTGLALRPAVGADADAPDAAAWLALAYQPFVAEPDLDGLPRLRRRSRPWRLIGRAGVAVGAWAGLDDALRRFLERAGVGSAAPAFAPGLGERLRRAVGF